jgi:hypothetical protein
MPRIVPTWLNQRRAAWRMVYRGATKDVTKHEAWQQDLFDLMANEKVKVTFEGEVGEVDAELYLYEKGRWELVATTINEEGVDEAMTELLRQVEAARNAVS